VSKLTEKIFAHCNFCEQFLWAVSNFFAVLSSKIIALADPVLSQPDMEWEMVSPPAGACAYIPSFTMCHVLQDLPGDQEVPEYRLLYCTVLQTISIHSARPSTANKFLLLHSGTKPIHSKMSDVRVRRFRNFGFMAVLYTVESRFERLFPSHESLVTRSSTSIL
jgi:hypothetical protein